MCATPVSTKAVKVLKSEMMIGMAAVILTRDILNQLRNASSNISGSIDQGYDPSGTLALDSSKTDPPVKNQEYLGS
ncbi:hypothetical protein PGT21_028567 [Puccinia graminis f. sp. tritici]|uniref:Uncharacterized protein n=1 Tax=Puccinia graminis f. sp. tritici TaxID=56615 RepID=A0A5B0S4A5_PUCGR|nr:hypothetical protein PGT21_028567 [Puccinia graminis f. sp. tritici]KAA1133006.1 hypothetical protein PGTUg99_021692 [Puccinia graminis f. sp. tritici]